MNESDVNKIVAAILTLAHMSIPMEESYTTDELLRLWNYLKNKIDWPEDWDPPE